MASNTAKAARNADTPRKRVVIVIYPGVTLLDAAGPAQVFSGANDALSRSDKAPLYDLVLTSPKGGDIRTDTGIILKTLSTQSAAGDAIDTLIISGGVGVFDLLEEQRFLRWVRDCHGDCRRLATTCMGAFVTAKAGLLEGQRVATHWRYTERLQCEHPETAVEKDPLFVRSGKIWSAAGVTAGIDLALAMVEEDLGHGIAMEVAKALVVFFKRPGGQSQFSNVLVAQSDDGEGTFAALHAWIAENLQADLRVEALAERTAMSPRSFARRYRAQTGQTPAKAVERIRVDAAARLLAEGERGIAEVAQRTGFFDEQRLRRAFQRHLGVSPRDYRETFGRGFDGLADSFV